MNAAVDSIERNLENRFEQQCKRDGWIASLVLVNVDYTVYFVLEKIAKTPIVENDEDAARKRLQVFIMNEFGTEANIRRIYTSPSQPYSSHSVKFSCHLDASNYVNKALCE